ncbi:MAG: hypothetical protein ACD_3C00188G0004 [uncultured bacterium (gcode 4)]|uniref:Uncharacterized protein n=1 Tax=uncultured bacterium (gcode 4) TaxID=1234023 RepID=K2FXB6_9BACT|nr:MAG: hypothetical protein ACD_3C00188G0004 [uncultured bacterium (gcode 4)]
MNNLGLNETSLAEQLFSKRELLKIEISVVVEHILAWGDYTPSKTCGWSELRSIIGSWLRWELWERYRLLKDPQNEEILEEFIDLLSDF